MLFSCCFFGPVLHQIIIIVVVSSKILGISCVDNDTIAMFVTLSRLYRMESDRLSRPIIEKKKGENVICAPVFIANKNRRTTRARGKKMLHSNENNGPQHLNNNSIGQLNKINPKPSYNNIQHTHKAQINANNDIE